MGVRIKTGEIYSSSTATSKFFDTWHFALWHVTSSQGGDSRHRKVISAVNVPLCNSLSGPPIRPRCNTYNSNSHYCIIRVIRYSSLWEVLPCLRN